MVTHARHSERSTRLSSFLPLPAAANASDDIRICVVLTGMPKTVSAASVTALAASAQQEV